MRLQSYTNQANTVCNLYSNPRLTPIHGDLDHKGAGGTSQSREISTNLFIATFVSAFRHHSSFYLFVTFIPKDKIYREIIISLSNSISHLTAERHGQTHSVALYTFLHYSMIIEYNDNL